MFPFGASCWPAGAPKSTFTLGSTDSAMSFEMCGFCAVQRAALYADHVGADAAVSGSDGGIGFPSTRFEASRRQVLSATVRTKRSPETGHLSLQVQMVAGARNPLNLEFPWSVAEVAATS
jgi:hypothetical protein